MQMSSLRKKKMDDSMIRSMTNEESESVVKDGDRDLAINSE